MARKRTAAKTSTINRAAPVLSALLERYCRGLDNWPRAWMGLEKDLPPGEKLVACFRPFLEELVASDLSPKTIQKHVHNLWALGGEIVRDVHETPSLRRKSIERSLDDRIDNEGGCSMAWIPSSNSAPSIPPARSLTGSSANRLAEPVNSPTNSPDEAKVALTNVSKKWKAATTWRTALNHFTLLYGDRRRRGTGRHDSKPGLRAKTRRSGPACDRKGSLPAAGWRREQYWRNLLTKNPKHYLPDSNRRMILSIRHGHAPFRFIATQLP
jgi:hypothetical protein